MRLEEVLNRRGVSAEQIAAALEDSSAADPIQRGELLLQKGVIDETTLLESWGELYGVEVLASIPDEYLDPALIGDLPVEWSRSHLLLPIRRGAGFCAVGCTPAALRDLDYLCLVVGRELPLVLAPKQYVEKAIERCYFHRKGSTRELLEKIEQPPAATLETRAAEDLLRAADDAPITQLVNTILLEALKVNASDVHVEPYEKTLRIRYRIDGLLYEQSAPPKPVQSALISRLKVMAHLDIAEKRLPQDGAARVRVGEREIDIRVSTIPVAEGERVVLRLLNRESALLPLAALGMPEHVLESFRRIVHEPYGMVLVTGPTGSGKTTTLYAALRELDTAHRNILTIEDPIEYQLPDIGQMQVAPKIGLTFAAGLRHILRQDPDVILVGETRDLETAEIAVRAALTGHMVLTTVHTNDAASAVVRLNDIGIPAYLLASALRAVLAQRLIRKLCGNCRKSGQLSDEDRMRLGPAARVLLGTAVMQPVGCAACLGGFRGRTGLFELLEIDAGLAEMIRKGLGPNELREAATQRGMSTLLDDGLARILSGDTCPSEVLRAVGQTTG